MSHLQNDDMMQFVDMGDELGSEFELSEDGGSSVASSADVNFDHLNSFDNPIDQFLNYGHIPPPQTYAQQTVNPNTGSWLNLHDANVDNKSAFKQKPLVTPQPPQVQQTYRHSGVAEMQTQEIAQLLDYGEHLDAPISRIPPLETVETGMDEIYNEISEQVHEYKISISDFPSRSRVETQIRCRLEIKRANIKDNTAEQKFLLHLPGDCIARPKFRLVDSNQTLTDPRVRPYCLWLSVDAINSEYPTEQVLMCQKCLARERRRAFRKKTMDPHEETYWNKVDERRILIFNCREVMPLDGDGRVELPLRVACYCRHHAAKNGFNIVFTLKNAEGKVVGRALSSSIFITDSHKDQAGSTTSSVHGMHNRVGSISSSNGSSMGGLSHPYLRPGSSLPPVPQQMHGQNTRSHSTHSLSAMQSPSPQPVQAPSPSQTVPSWVANVQDDSVDAWSGGPNSWMSQGQQRMPVPSIFRAIPPSGSIRGGIDVTLLGQNLHGGLVVLFGGVPAVSVQCWSDSTIIAQLPPSSQPGVVPITLQNAQVDVPAQNKPPTTFTYVNDGDDKLKEIALQMIGYKSTGKIEDAANVAQRILEAGPSTGSSKIKNEESILDPNITAEQFALWVLTKFPSNQGGLNINLRNSEGQTMLHLASMLGYASIVKCALALGAYVDSQDVGGYSPLHFAVMCGNRSITRILLAADADPFHRTRNGYIARDIADSTVQDLLPTDQRAWYSELNHRGSSSSLASLAHEFHSATPTGVSIHPSSTNNSHISAGSAIASDESGSDDDGVLMYNPPPYSQLYPANENGIRRRKISNKSQDDSEVIEIDVPSTARSPENNLLQQQGSSTFSKYKNKFLYIKNEVSNDKMLLTFWIPLALAAICGLCCVYMMQHYGSVQTHPLANAVGDMVKQCVLKVVNTILPMLRQTQATVGRQIGHHARAVI